MSSSKRLPAVRIDFVIQSLWLAIVGYEALLLSSEGWNEDVPQGLMALLLWQIPGSILFSVWKSRAGRAGRGWRGLAAVVLLGTLGLHFVAAVAGALLAIVSLSEEPLRAVATFMTWVTLPVVVGYFALTFWEAWMSRAARSGLEAELAALELESRGVAVETLPNVPEASAPLPVAPESRGARLWPLLRPWLRFVVPTGLLALAVEAFHHNLPYQLAGQDWSPVLFCGVVLLLGWLFSLGLKQRRPEGWPFAVWSRLWWLAALPPLIVAVAFVPPVRQKLREIDHARILSWESFPGPLGIAERRDLYGPSMGPDLLRRKDLVEAHLKQYEEDLSPYTDLRADRQALGLYFAALRLQGESVEEIAGRSIGPQLITGAVLAEAEPPYWLPKAAWLLEALEAKPEGTFRLGLIAPAQASQFLSRWAADSHLNGVMTPLELEKYDPFKDDPQRWREHGRRVALAEGLINACLRHDRLLDPALVEKLLRRHEEQTAPAEARRSVAEAISARDRFRAWATPLADAEGRLSLSLHWDAAHFPPYKTVRALTREKLGEFVRSCGFMPDLAEPITPEAGAPPEPAAGAALRVKLVPQSFDDLPLTTRSSHLRTRVKTVRHLRPGRYGGYSTRQVTETEIISRSDSTRGALVVASLELGFGDQTLLLRPAGEVDRTNADVILAWVRDGKFPLSVDYISVIAAYYHLADTALSAWRYGTPSWSDPASQLFWDDWDDISPDSPTWD